MSIDDARPAGEIPPYQVRRVETDPAAAAAGHHHVSGVATVDPDGGETQWTLVQVIAAVRDGERFVMGGGQGGQAVDLEPSACPRCRLVTLSIPTAAPARPAG
ncbi:MAG TPA: hypothetical protein VF365_03495 [Candidatus Limnocylindria bacterium]